ncbi:MAG: GMC family oxidoreductase [Acidobacteria bacterium]|nr:GMC family oxidoreductase [Acidobacteriota bacterium]
MATTKTYDAIVVGTGAGGGTALKILCEAGLNVLALNSGPRTDPEKDYKLHRQSFDLKYRGFGDPTIHNGLAHRERYSVEETEYNEGPHLWEHDVAYSNAVGTNWYWKRCKGTGGKANFWGRSSCRYGDIDFKAASLDGFGEDWPVDYAEISPWFSKAEKYMGVASTIQNRPSNPDGDYLPPIPWRCFDHIMQKAGEKIGVPYLPDRCAQLTVAHNGHPACHYCGNCSQGCDVGSFFSPTWFTIPDAEKTQKLTLVTDALVHKVLVDETGKATGVAYVDRKAKREVEVFAKVIVLAASCVETAHIMLNSKSRHWPSGIANSSGQLGKNLCDHLYGTPGYGYLPQLLGQPPSPDNIADSTVAWLPRWQNLNGAHEEKFIRGYSMYMYGGCGDFPGHYRQIEGFGSSFKREVKRYYPAPISFLIQAPSLPSPANYIDIDPEKKDIFGIPQLRFHFQWGPNELMMWEHSKQVVIDLFKASGGEMWGAGSVPDRPGTSLHETGVCRFGSDPKTSVTNKWAQAWDVPNLYICDSSVFPNPTDKTTTMPIVAFAMRTCDNILANFKKGLHKRA